MAEWYIGNFASGYRPWPNKYFCRPSALLAGFPVGLIFFFRFGFHSATLGLAQIKISYFAQFIAEITVEIPVKKQLIIASKFNSFLMS